jgi:hypothetical protein
MGVVAASREFGSGGGEERGGYIDKGLQHGARRPARLVQPPVLLERGLPFWKGRSGCGPAAAWVVLMHPGTTARIDNEPFLSIPAPALTRIPVSLTLQFPSERPQPSVSGARVWENPGFWSRLGDNGMSKPESEHRKQDRSLALPRTRALCVSGTWIQSILGTSPK